MAANVQRKSKYEKSSWKIFRIPFYYMKNVKCMRIRKISFIFLYFPSSEWILSHGESQMSNVVLWIGSCLKNTRDNDNIRNILIKNMVAIIYKLKMNYELLSIYDGSTVTIHELLHSSLSIFRCCCSCACQNVNFGWSK